MLQTFRNQTVHVVMLGLLGVSMVSCDSSPGTLSQSPMATGSAEALIEWNQKLLEAAEAEDGFLTLKGLRSVTLFHLAVQDALESSAIEDSSPLAVVAGAGYRIATSQYPDADSQWQFLRDRWGDQARGQDQLDDEAARGRGLVLGAASADKRLAERDADGWNAEASYQWHPMAPGVYAEFNEHSGTPEGFIFGAGWAQVEPFALDSPDHFVSAPPPEISSPEYTAAFNEVKQVGRFESENRTDDQSHLAMWWKEFVESSHNRLGRELVLESELSLAEANRFFLLLNVAIHDAYVSSFHNKFLYNHWRPYTAIRWAEHDDNPATEAEPDWNNLHRHTYAFPSYPSAHGTACAAAMTAFADTFGEDREFTMTIPEVESAGPFSQKVAMDPPSRSFGSFGQAAEECASSRVYLGIHFRYDSVAGTELGRKVGGLVVERLG